MPSSKRLIVGLGNPGPDYDKTRHNVGFEVVDRLADRARIELNHKYNAMIGEASLKGRPVILARPLTYMNRSGEAVERIRKAFQLDPKEILIIYDDLNLDLGRIRLRPGGSAGGHNGLQSVIDHLGTRSVPRLRLGIGNDFPRGGQSAYVLAPFAIEEQEEAEAMIEEACQSVVTYVRAGIQEAMNTHNN